MAPQNNTLECAPTRALKPYKGNARTHSKKQIEQIARSITAFGWTNPILVDDALGVIAGHGRLQAAELLGFETVPIIRLSHLTDAQKRAYVLADNRLAEKAGWDRDLLAMELQGLIEFDFDLDLAGFEPAQVDLILCEADEARPDATTGPENRTPTKPDRAVTREGDTWVLGRHRLVCGDAREARVYQALLQGEAVDAVFTDPPYNVKISGHVRTSSEHREFVMAAGEMSTEQFESFLQQTLTHTAAHCRQGAIAFVCMDWRHIRELTTAGAAVFGDLKQLCVWAKSNGGMGSFYRSQHELVFVYRVGEAPHLNTFELGQHGRYRTNVWSYPGVNSFKAGRGEELSMHSTVKPVTLVEDAIKDVTKRNQVVLDIFGGSGTTLIAAQKCGRRARLVELDRGYCDVIVERYQRYTGKLATLEQTGATYEDVAIARDLDLEARHE
ncbi:DNA modification methylase [alpha proteobacterium U9-1i]|nr:DNA modification methylase [alpha proteobacterium U9-1i]